MTAIDTACPRDSKRSEALIAAIVLAADKHRSLPRPDEKGNPLNSSEVFKGSELELSSTLRADKSGQPETESFTLGSSQKTEKIVR